MSAAAAHALRLRAPPFIEPLGCAQHRPEKTLLYQSVEQHYTAFRELRSEAGRPFPDHIEQECDAYLKCGRPEESCLRVCVASTADVPTLLRHERTCSRHLSEMAGCESPLTRRPVAFNAIEGVEAHLSPSAITRETLR